MYITAKNIKRKGIDLSNVTYVGEEVHREIYGRCNPQKGDILYIKDGATCGISTINNLDEEFSLLSSVALIKPNRNILNSYLNIYLQSEFCYRNVRRSMKGVGITRIILKQMELWEIPIPPYEEQKRIVRKAEYLLCLAEEMEKEQTELRDFVLSSKVKMLDLAIHGKLVPQNPSDEPALELLKRINPAFKPSDNLHYIDCPTGWAIATVSDIFEINPRVQAPDDADAGFVAMANICDGFDDVFSYEVRKWGSIKKGFTRFEDGDIAVAKISPCLENRKSVILRNLPNGIGAGTTELNIFRSSIVVPEYGLMFFKSDYFINSCAGSYNGVVGQQRVSRSLIEEMPFLLPPIDEQRRIISAVNDYFAVLNRIEAALLEG